MTLAQWASLRGLRGNPWRPDLPGFNPANEALVLERLAAETARTDPLTAAQRLFGGDR